MSTYDFDGFGTPTFYATKFAAEPAGHGNVRIWACSERNGSLVPHCELIIPAEDLLLACQQAREFALNVIDREMLVEGPTH